jgi:hypothetical protein
MGRREKIASARVRVGAVSRVPARRKQLESSIEGSCRDHAHERGWTSRKMNGLGFNSWPDRIFIARVRPRGMRRALRLLERRTFWVEFKRPGEVPTAGQWRMIRDLRSRGETVYVIDNREDFIKVFNEHNA